MEDNVYKFGFFQKEKDSETCDDNQFLTAIVSIEVQNFGQVYETERGFCKGTIFPPLNKPFLAGGVCSDVKM